MDEREEKKKEQIRKRKEQSRQRANRYYQKNKEKVLEKNKKEVNCKYCGRLINIGSIWKHKNSRVCVKAYEYLKNSYGINPDKICCDKEISQQEKDKSIFDN